jgi:hypothetical protein
LDPPLARLSLEEDSPTTVIVARSLDVPFKMIGLKGPSFLGSHEIPTLDQQTHRFRLNLDRGKFTRPSTPLQHLKILTTHPTQPTISLPVLISQ